MARITKAALALVLCLTQSTITSVAASTTLIDSTGAIARTSISQSTIGNGIVAVLTSPGTKSYFNDEVDDVVTLSSYNGVSILSSPGATLTGTSSLAKGNGAAASSAVAGSIILSGITASDLEQGLDDTRHGQTLIGIFKQKIQDGGEEKTTLIVAVPGSTEVDEEVIMSDIKGIFDSACAEVGAVVDISDVYDVSVENVDSEADAERVSDVQLLE